MKREEGKITLQLFSLKKKISGLVNIYLSNKVEEFKRDYRLNYQRDPEEIEIVNFRKRFVMSKGILVYLVLAVGLFFLVGRFY